MNKQQTREHYESMTREAMRLSPIERVMDAFKCSREDAQRYLDLREEGHSQYEAALMAGLADPHD